MASWVGITGTESLAPLNGGVPLADSVLLVIPTLAWVAVAIVLAARMFRWEPRR